MPSAFDFLRPRWRCTNRACSSRCVRQLPREIRRDRHVRRYFYTSRGLRGVAVRVDYPELPRIAARAIAN